MWVLTGIGLFAFFEMITFLPYNTMKNYILILFWISSLSLNAQQINGGYSQGLVALVPNKFEDTHDYKNIRPDVHAGFWKIRVAPAKWAWEGLQVIFEVDINQPTLVRGANAEGGEHDYDISEFNLAITGSMEFSIEGDYTNPNTQERVSFTKNVYVPNLGSNALTDSELFGYSGNVTNFKTVQEIINYLKVEIRSIKALNKYISGYQRIDINLGHILKEKRNDIQFNNLLADAKNADELGRTDEAIEKYEALYALNKDPKIKQRIEELKAWKQKQEDEKNALVQPQAENNKQPNEKEIEESSDRRQGVVDTFDHTIPKHELTTTTLDFWGNPVVTQNAVGEAKTVSYAGTVVENNSTYQQQMQLREDNVAKKAAWEQEEALKRRSVDDYNSNLVGQSNDVYQQSLNIDKDMNEALAQISPETYGDPKAMIQTGMNLLSTANGNLGQAYTGAALGGVGLATGLLNDLAKVKAKKEAAAERARIRKEAEAKKKAIRESIKKARLAVFKGYPQGELPLSSTASKGNNLYYFVYAYNQDQLLQDSPKVKTTKVFAIGKYPDGTWPMKTKIEDEVNSLTPLQETICGPFYSLSEANSVYNSFLSYVDKTNMGIDALTYEGFNAHSEIENLQQTAPKVDFWGNPIKN
ncbi:hypothetical protein NA63_0119 [Flavobacteriaceae bacterium MAR_2010_105]|nr:hypothetical protein NA63_0119 [Flavobacteriaceae bacterium MAR_2010_105]